MIGSSKWKEGDWVVYRKQKSSPAPGPRAQQITPTSKGEVYHYLVDKYWIVQRVRGDGKLELRTRQGKVHLVDESDFRLRPAKWWERLFLANRFPAAEPKPPTAPSSTSADAGQTAAPTSPDER